MLFIKQNSSGFHSKVSMPRCQAGRTAPLSARPMETCGNQGLRSTRGAANEQKSQSCVTKCFQDSCCSGKARAVTWLGCLAGKVSKRLIKRTPCGGLLRTLAHKFNQGWHFFFGYFVEEAERQMPIFRRRRAVFPGFFRQLRPGPY